MLANGGTTFGLITLCVLLSIHFLLISFQKLSMLKKKFPTVPILAMTATATAKVRGDILCTLGISKNCVTFSQSFNRPNLRSAKNTKSLLTL